MNRIITTPLENKVKLRDLGSKAGLQQYVRLHPNMLTLGHGAECPKEFWCIDFQTEKQSISIALIASGHGIRPALLPSTDGTSLALGHDCEVSFIDIPGRSLIREETLQSPFYEFVSVEDRSQLIAIHELGAAKFDFAGNQKWAITAADIVVKWAMKDARTLIIHQWESKEELVIDVQTGAMHRSMQ